MDLEFVYAHMTSLELKDDTSTINYLSDGNNLVFSYQNNYGNNQIAFYDSGSGDFIKLVHTYKPYADLTPWKLSTGEEYFTYYSYEVSLEVNL